MNVLEVFTAHDFEVNHDTGTDMYIYYKGKWCFTYSPEADKHCLRIYLGDREGKRSWFTPRYAKRLKERFRQYLDDIPPEHIWVSLEPSPLYRQIDEMEFFMLINAFCEENKKAYARRRK